MQISFQKASPAGVSPFRRTLLLSFLLINLAAVDSPGQIRRHKFERFSTDQGLSNPTVFCMLQDREGYLWFGTLDGLNRYDGHTFKVYRRRLDDSTSLLDNTVYTIYEDRRGDFWIGTYEGYLFRFDRTSDQFRPVTLDSAGRNEKKSVFAIQEDNAGNLWVGTLGAGIYVLDSGRTGVTRLRNNPESPSSLSNDFVYAMHRDELSRMWVCSGRGLEMFNPTSRTFTHHMYDPHDSTSIPHNTARSICSDPQGNILVGTWGGGFGVKQKGKTTFYRFLGSGNRQGSEVFALLVDRNGKTWAGTSDGIFWVDLISGTHTRLAQDPDDPSSLSDNVVLSLLEDRSGTLWIGTTRGLCKFVPRTEQFGHRGISNDQRAMQGVRAILRDSRGDLWVGSEGLGLFRYNRRGDLRAHHVHDSTNIHSLGSNGVLSLLEDSNGNVWVGTAGGGVNRYNNSSGTFDRFYYNPKELGSQWTNAVFSIAEGSEDDIWLGTWDAGLARLEKRTGQLTVYRHSSQDSSSLSNDRVMALWRDRKGRLWIGTEGGGLDLLDNRNGRFTHFRHRNGDPTSLSNNRVYAMAEGGDGSLWIGTALGLNKLDLQSHTFREYHTKDGLPSEYIKGIVLDNRKDLWIATADAGISKLPLAEGRFVNFDENDGLQSNVFYTAVHLDQGGLVYFGGPNGINVFHPDSIVTRKYSPPMVITGFSVFDKPSDMLSRNNPNGTLTLSYSENFFSFEFAILDFMAPERNVYAYKLEGFDRDWNLTGSRRYAAYTNVPPDKYVLLYKGTNSDGIWMEKEGSLDIYITPPFWETFWFRSGVITLMAGLLYALYRYRLAKLLEMERMRVRIASDLHDEIGSSLASVGLLVDSVRRRLPDIHRKEKDDLQSARHSASHTAETLRDIVWIINPEHDREDLLSRMRYATAQLLVGVEYTFSSAGTNIPAIRSPEFRRNLILIYKEILHNIVKHSKATKAEISVRCERGTLSLRVADNGVGFDEQSVLKGMGLNSMRNRAEKLGSSLGVHSCIGGGTAVTLSVRIPH